MAKPRRATQPGLNPQLPKRAADSFARALRGMSETVKRLLIETVVPAVRLGDQAAVDRAIAALQSQIDSEWSADRLRDLARPVAAKANENHSNKFFAALALFLGVRILFNDIPGSGDARDLEEARGALTSGGRSGKLRLIPKLNAGPAMASEDFADGIALFVGKLRDGVSEGVRIDIERAQAESEDSNKEEIAAALLLLWLLRGGGSNIGFDRRTQLGEPVLVRVRNHTDMIVLDQFSKMNSAFTGLRERAVGIPLFVWETRRDSRVRPAHRALQGRIFEWAEGANGILPGRPPGCRCWARALIDRDQVLASGGWIFVDGPAVDFNAVA